jgi:hypothetical protein
MSWIHLIGLLCATLVLVAVATIANTLLNLSGAGLLIVAVGAFLLVRQVFIHIGGHPSPRKRESES